MLGGLSPLREVYTRQLSQHKWQPWSLDLWLRKCVGSSWLAFSPLGQSVTACGQPQPQPSTCSSCEHQSLLSSCLLSLSPAWIYLTPKQMVRKEAVASITLWKYIQTIYSCTFHFGNNGNFLKCNWMSNYKICKNIPLLYLILKSRPQVL